MMALEADRLSFSYGEAPVLSCASFGLPQGGFAALIGPNGAGKSTLLKLLLGELSPSSGAVRLLGQDTARFRNWRRLGYVPQDGLARHTDFPASVEEVVLANLSGEIGLFRFPRPEHRERVRQALELVGMAGYGRRLIGALSGGQRQRVGIAQALLGDPAFLIFDEPTVGLDPEERIHFRNLFSRLAQDRLVLLSTHIIEDVQSVCSRLLVLHQGRLRFDGTPEELIRAAEGHVGTFEARAGGREDGLHITARVNTARGVACRAVAETLPPYVRPAEPTLEDAYLYLISGEGEA